MKRETLHYINLMRKYVIEYLINEYNFNKNNAITIVNNSSFNKLLMDEPDYVMHYNVEYWAERIKKENDRIIQYV